jgi:hypothetical protein
MFALAKRLDVSRAEAMHLVIACWSWADSVTADGEIPHLTPDDLDAIVRQPGFGQAMLAVEWLEQNGHGLRFPKWDRWNSDSAKARLRDRDRKRAVRTLSETCPEIRGQKPDGERTNFGLQDRTGQGRSSGRNSNGD